MHRIIVTYPFIKSTSWIEILSIFFFFFLSSARSYQIGLFSTTMRIFPDPESKNAICCESSGNKSWNSIEAGKEGEMEICVSSQRSISSSMFYEQKRTTTTTTTTFKRNEIGQTREGKAKFTRFSFREFAALNRNNKSTISWITNFDSKIRTVSPILCINE